MIEQYINDRLANGRAYFTRKELRSANGASDAALSAALTRQIKTGRIANPWRGFYLIVRPEDQIAGAPDPARWIDPMMRHLQLDYRISLLRAAAFHGSSHQAAMVFQVVVPKQLRGFEIGRHRLEFVYQAPSVFEPSNQKRWLRSLKSDAGYAKVAGIELTLLDCARYFHRTGGINGLSQIVKDLGRQAVPAALGKAAVHFENSSVRRLGYLLERMGHSRQAEALRPFVRRAKSMVPLDPSVRTFLEGIDEIYEKAPRWMLVVNELVEVDF
jgi:predicted transcriptional regulator of viral defense system